MTTLEERVCYLEDEIRQLTKRLRKVEETLAWSLSKEVDPESYCDSVYP